MHAFYSFLSKRLGTVSHNEYSDTFVKAYDIIFVPVLNYCTVKIFLPLLLSFAY